MSVAVKVAFIANHFLFFKEALIYQTGSISPPGKLSRRAVHDPAPGLLILFFPLHPVTSQKLTKQSIFE